MVWSETGPPKKTPDSNEPQHRGRQGLTPMTAKCFLLNPHNELILYNQKRKTPNHLNIIYVHLWLLHNNSKDCSCICKYIRIIRHFSASTGAGWGPALLLNSRSKTRTRGQARPVPPTLPDHPQEGGPAACPRLYLHRLHSVLYGMMIP